MRQLRPKEIMYTKVSCSFLYRLGILIDLEPQGNLSVNTTRLLKVILPASCLWTSLRESEGFRYDRTIKELRTLYPTEEESMDADEQEDVLGSNVPQSIRDMLGCKSAMEALGSMIWFVYFFIWGLLLCLTVLFRYLRQLNIDKDILSMKNFDIYDPMKRGQGLVLDGQTLAHIEVSGRECGMPTERSNHFLL